MIDPFGFFIHWLIQPVFTWINDVMLTFVNFILASMVAVSNTLLDSVITQVTTDLIQAIAIGMFAIGLTFSIYDYFNGLDNSNAQYSNHNFGDKLVPIIISGAYTCTYVKLTLLTFTAVQKLSVDILNVTEAGYVIEMDKYSNLPFLTKFTHYVGPGMMILVLGIIIFSAWDLFKEVMTKAPLLIITMGVGAIKPFSIARGNVDEVFTYIKSIFGIGLVMTIKLMFFVWGISLILVPDTTSLCVGIGLVIASKNVEKALGELGNSISTQYGGRNGISNAMRNFSLAKGFM